MSLIAPSGEIVLAPFFDPVAEARGFDPDSHYVDHCWLPLLGPTSTVLYRRLFERLLSGGPVARLDGRALAQDIGLSGHLRRLELALARLRDFGFVVPAEPYLLLRQRAEPLRQAALARLTPEARRWHEDSVSPRR